MRVEEIAKTREEGRGRSEDFCRSDRWYTWLRKERQGKSYEGVRGLVRKMCWRQERENEAEEGKARRDLGARREWEGRCRDEVGEETRER